MSSAYFEHGHVMVRRSRRRLSRFFARAAVALAVGPVALRVLAALLHALGLPDASDAADVIWFLCWLPGVPVATALSIVAGVRARGDDARLQADPSLLVLHQRGVPLTFARDAIEGALPVAGDASRVEIALAGGDVLEIELYIAADRSELVEVLGFGPSERRTVVPLGGARAPLGAGCLGVTLGALATIVFICVLGATKVPFPSDLSEHLGGLVFVVASVLLARRFTPGRLVVGADGILVEGAFRNRFVPLPSIAGVDMTTQGPALTVRDGDRVEKILLAWDADVRGTAMVALIAAALESAGRRGAPEGSTLVARGGRTLGAWRESLRRLTGGAAGYRGEAVSVETLLRTAASPDASAEQRLGAAIAIGLADDAEAKQRLRVATEGIVNEELRAAMAGAAEGAAEEAAIEEALAVERRAVRRG